MENSRMTKQTLHVGRRMEKEEQRQKSPGRLACSEERAARSGILPHPGHRAEKLRKVRKAISCSNSA